MLGLFEVVGAIFIYVLLLFVIAIFGEKKAQSPKNFLNHPLVYTLSLGVYCTSWAFYGSVGSAAHFGVLFLTIYLGPTLNIILWWGLLRKLVRIKNKFNITSMVDLIAARYDKSESLGFMASSFIVFGLIPYLALQLKAIIKTIHLLTLSPEVSSIQNDQVGHFVVLIMILCSIFFGIRKLNISERHPGMVLVLAVESLVKLLALLSVGIIVAYFMNDGIGDIFKKFTLSSDHQFNILGTGDRFLDIVNWLTYLVLSFNAVLFLPRQFHIAVVENNKEEHVKMAKWLFPLYLFLINIFVLPIALGGLLAGLDPASSDFFVLLLAVMQKNKLFSLFVFIGGFSAAAGMIMIETVTISTMVTNSIFLPVFTRIRPLSFLTRHLLRLRWLAASLLIVFSYLFMNIVGEKNDLLSMGLIAFVAALQFAPIILGGIYWKGGSKTGAFAGLSAGALIWFFTLVIPSFSKSGFIGNEVLDHGIFGLSFLRPEALLGLGGLPYLTHATFWTLFFNIGSYFMFSLLFPASETEKKMALEFVGAIPWEENNNVLIDSSHNTVNLGEKIEMFRATLLQFCNDEGADKVIEQSLLKQGLKGDQMTSVSKLTELYLDVEVALSGIIGTAASHKALKRANVITAEENEELSKTYGALLANMKVNPNELKKQIVLYQEKEKLMKYETDLLAEILEKKTRELEEQKGLTLEASKMAALGEMAAGIAHEINNPLSIIKMNNQLMMKLIDKDPAHNNVTLHRYCANIDSTITRISKIIMGLMAISRNDRYEEVALHRLGDILEDVLPFCQEKFKTNGIKLTVNLSKEEQDIKILCSRVQISQVLLNLLNNSFDAVLNLTERWIVIEARVLNKKVEISVTDSGTGVSKELQEKIFQPFFTTKDVGKGTGLGLSLSSAIIRNHKGTLGLDNKSPHTRFVVCLPL